MTTKERLHRLIDRLPESEQETAERVLEGLALRATRREPDALTRLLEHAPADDEPWDEEDAAAAKEGWEDYQAGRTLTVDEVRRELGL